MTKSVFKLGAQDGYQCLTIRDTEWQFILTTRPGDLAGLWNIREAELHTTDERDLPVRRSDFPDLGGRTVLMISQRAREVLAPLLEGAAQLRPVKAGGETYFAVLDVVRVDCLDRGASEIVWQKEGEGEGAMAVTRHVFRPEALGRFHLFGLPEFYRSPTYVDEVFVKATEEAQLQGMAFRRVWSEG